MTDRTDPNRLQRDFYPVWAREGLRAADMDRNDHAHNAAYLHYLEAGRYALLREHGLLALNITGIVAHLAIDYLGEVTFPGAVDVGTAVAHVGRSSLRLVQGVFFEGRCAAVAETVLVFRNRASRQPYAIEGEFRNRLAALLQHKPSRTS